MTGRSWLVMALVMTSPNNVIPQKQPPQKGKKKWGEKKRKAKKKPRLGYEKKCVPGQDFNPRVLSESGILTTLWTVSQTHPPPLDHEC